MSDEQNEALKDVTVSLIAAVSLLRRLHDDLPKSKRHALFGSMVADYEKSIERGRAALKWDS